MSRRDELNERLRDYYGAQRLGDDALARLRGAIEGAAGEAQTEPEVDREPAAPAPVWRGRWAWLLAAAAVLVVCVSAGWLLRHGDGDFHQAARRLAELHHARQGVDPPQPLGDWQRLQRAAQALPGTTVRFVTPRRLLEGQRPLYPLSVDGERVLGHEALAVRLVDGVGQPATLYVLRPCSSYDELPEGTHPEPIVVDDAGDRVSVWLWREGELVYWLVYNPLIP